MAPETTDNYVDFFNPEAERRRLQMLVKDRAENGLKSSDSLPPSVMQMIADYRANRLRFANSIERNAA